MNFKPELLNKVLLGTKTQTRRLVKQGEGAAKLATGPVSVFTPKGHVKWTAGKDYAAAPGRGKHGVARIKVTNIRREYLSEITEADARAEGFANRDEFFQA